MRKMLTENDIIENLAYYLKSNGYVIEQKLSTNQPGIDLIAENNSEKLYIEAKGETSALKTSNRYGNPFNRNQVKTHIGVALLATMRVITSQPAGNRTKVGIALPDNEEQRRVISEIINALKQLEIKIYWVTNDTITIE